MSQRKADDYIEVDLDLDELDITSAESKATYAEIKDYVLKEHGLKVSNLYISQVKRKCGLCEELSEEFSESSIRITGILREWDVIHTLERSKNM